MCLRSVYSDQDKAKFLASLSDELITVYKLVKEDEGRYYPIYFDFLFNRPFKEGMQRERKIFTTIETDDCGTYKAGFHLFLHQKDAESYGYSDLTYGQWSLIECKIKKSWITAVGTTRFDMKDISLITKKIIFPKRGEGKVK